MSKQAGPDQARSDQARSDRAGPVEASTDEPGPDDAGPDDAGPDETSAVAKMRLAGLRATRPRISVYETLAAMGGHRSADDVLASLAASGHVHARATVFNALADLARSGLIMVADAGPGVRLYEAGTVWHHHAVCRTCGAVTDIDCLVGAKPCIRPLGEWGEVDEAQVIFRGHCARCVESRTSRSS